MKQEHRFWEAGKIVSSDDSVPTKIHPTDAAKLISNQSGERQRAFAHGVHGWHVSGGRPP